MRLCAIWKLAVVDVHLEPAEAYGERDERLVQTIPLDQLPGAEELSVGQRVMLSGPMGQPLLASVVAKDDTIITFDLNHEMAGKALNFNIELLEVE